MRKEVVERVLKRTFPNTFIGELVNGEFLLKWERMEGPVLIANPRWGDDITLVRVSVTQMLTVPMPFQNLWVPDFLPERFTREGAYVMRGSVGSIVYIPHAQRPTFIVNFRYYNDLINFTRDSALDVLGPETIVKNTLVNQLLGLTDLKIEVSMSEDFDRKANVVAQVVTRRLEYLAKIKTMQETASLRSEVTALKKELDEAKRLIKQYENNKYEILTEILPFYRKGWVLMPLLDDWDNVNWYLFNPVRVEVRGVQRNNTVLPIPEDDENLPYRDKLPFYIEGILVTFRETDIKAYALDVFHPNANNSSMKLYSPIGEELYLHILCLGDLSGKPLKRILDGIIPMFERANLSSAFSGTMTEYAEAIWDYLDNKEDIKRIEAWEV